jgi:hypothetical protein
VNTHSVPAAHRLARTSALDALACILPVERCDWLAEVLSDDIATLRHVVERGMGENTLRALASDLGYLESWGTAATGSPLPWPAPELLVMKFIAHHLWDPAKRESDPSHAAWRAGALCIVGVASPARSRHHSLEPRSGSRSDLPLGREPVRANAPSPESLSRRCWQPAALTGCVTPVTALSC